VLTTTGVSRDGVEAWRDNVARIALKHAQVMARDPNYFFYDMRNSGALFSGTSCVRAQPKHRLDLDVEDRLSPPSLKIADLLLRGEPEVVTVRTSAIVHEPLRRSTIRSLSSAWVKR
jgi:hypothetical protein